MLSDLSAMLGKLAVPILHHLTETVSHIDGMTMWDHNEWSNRRIWQYYPRPITRRLE